MPIDNSKLKKVYATLQQGGYEQDYDTFVKGFTGNDHYENRKKVYDLLTANGAQIGNSYEDFMKKMQVASAPAAPAPQKPTTAPAQAGTPAPSTAPAKPQPKKNQPLTPAERQAMVDQVQQMQYQTNASLQRTKNRMDFARSNAGLRVPRVTLGDKNSGVRLGQNTKVVAKKPHLNPKSGKMERTYVTESGNEYADRGAADLEQNSIDEARFQTERQEAYLLQEKRRIEQEMNQRGRELDAEAVDFSWRDMPRGAGPAVHTYNSSTANGRFADEKYKALLAQLNKVNDGLATLEEAKKGKASDRWIDDSSNWASKKGKQLLAFGAGAWRGLAHAVGKVSTWDMGMTDMMANGALYTAALDADKNGGVDGITPENRDLLNLTAYTNAIEGENAKHIGRGYKAGQVTGESLPFMIEMMLNPASKLGTTATNKLMREAVRRYGKEAVKKATKKYLASKIGTRLIGDAAGSAIMAGTTGQGRVLADTLNRLTGDVQFKVGDNGKIVYDGRDGAEDSVLKAYLKAFGAQTIENHSEMVGEYFAPFLGNVSSLTRKGMDKIGLGRVNKLIDDIGATNAAKMIDDFEKRTKWNGTFGEYAEEVAGNVENALLVGDNTLDTAENTGVFNLDQNIDTFLGVGLMGGFFAGAKTLSYRGPKRQALNEMSAAGKAIDNAIGGNIPVMEKWGNWRNTFLVGTDEEKKVALREVMDNTDLPINFRRGVLNFVKAAQKYEGIARAQESKVKNGEQDPVAQAYDESYDNGYDTTEPQAMNDAKNLLDMKREQLAKQLGIENADEVDDAIGDPLRFIDEQRKTGDMEKMQSAIEYANAKSAYDGMVQRVQDDIDSRVEESDATVDNRVNRNDGMIHPVTLKLQNGDGSDKRAYIVSGNVVMSEDGNGVDKEQSDKAVVVRDADTGEMRWLDASLISGMDEQIDPEEEKTKASQAIIDEMSQRAADNVDGKVSFNIGDTYVLTDGFGHQINATLVANEQGLAENEDGTVNVTYDLGYGPRTTAVSKEDIQRMVDETNMRRTVQAEQERQANATNQSQQVDEEVELPQYGVNDTFTLLDGDGAAVHGEVQGVSDDGVEIRTDEPLNGKRVQVIPVEEFEENVESISDADGKLVWKREYEDEGIGNEPGGEDGKPSEASLSLSTEQQKTGALPDEPQQTALERVPVNEETQEPMFEKADKETALDALNEVTGGNEENTAAIVNAQVEQATKALEALKKKKPTKKAPSLKGSPMVMVKAQQEADAAYNAAMEQYNAQVGAAEERLSAWTKIYALMNERKRAEREKQEAERRKRDAQLHDAAVAQVAEQKRMAAEKAAEQAEVGTHAVNPKLKEKWDKATKVEGNPNAITLADGSTLRGHYVLTEAGAATASHDVNNAYEPTEGFPIDENGESVNDRDYKRDTDAQQIVRDIANNYDSRALQSPVIVSKDGIVLSGNNRTMSGELAAQQGTDKAYVDHLREFGQMYGFTPEQIDGMKHPRVVFVPDEELPYDAATFARFNAEQQKKQSKPEQAVKLGKVVPDNVFESIVGDISRYDRLSDYYADEKAVNSAISQLQRAGVINEMQLPEMRTGNALSAAGKELIENTLIGKVFQTSPDAVRQIIATPTLRQSVIMGLNEIAHNRTLAKSGYDLSQELGAAVDLVARAKASDGALFKEGMPVSPFGRQQGLFDDEYGDSRVTDGVTLMLADILNSGKPSELRKYLSVYNSEAETPAGGQLDMFSGKVTSKEELLNRLTEYFRNATPREQQAIVDAAIAERKQRAETTAQGADGTGRDGNGEPNTKAGKNGELDNNGRLEERRAKILSNMGDKYSLSEEHADNGEAFIQNENGSTDLAKIPDEIFDRIGISPVPFKLTETMGWHVFDHHGKEAKLNSISDAVDFVLSIVNNVDHVRLGRDNSYIFSVENNRKRVGRRAVTIMINSKTGEFMGIRTSGYETLKSIKERPLLWERGADTAPEDVATPTITTIEPQQGDERTSRAKSQSNVSSDSKVINNQSDLQENSEKSSANNGVTPLSEQIATASADVNTEPTEAQKEAGNYKKGHVQVGTFDITIEQPEGSVRKGTDADGKHWESKMHNTYGYFRGTEGVDGDHIDVFLSNDIDGWNGRKVYVVDQYNPDGTFDEHKVMLGFNDMDEAKSDYLANYEKGWEDGRRIDVSAVNLDDFEKWVESSHRKTKPFAEYAGVKKETANVGSMGNAGSMGKPSYTITPSTYTNKKGKTSDVSLLTFDHELTAEQERAVKEFAKERTGDGRFAPARGWKDRESGGWMFRKEEDARKAAEMVGSEEAVADNQPLTAQELRDAVEPKKPAARKKATAKKPANKVEVADVVEQKPTEPTKAEKPVQNGEKKLVITDEMKHDEDILRELLGIGDDEVAGGMKFRDPDALTSQQRRFVYNAGVNYSLGYIDQGFVKFPEFAKAMVSRLGYKIKPWLKSFYEGAKRIPGYDQSMFTPTEEVDAFDVENFDKPHKDVLAQANMIVEEDKAQAAANKANNELKEIRNEQRKETEKQTAADTDAVAAEAETAASEAESLAETSSDEQELNGASERVDDALDKVSDQLALLGYYEADPVEKDFNEAYGYMRNAEKKAVKDAAKLASQLIDDLGLDRYEATHSDKTDKKGNRKTKPLAAADIAPAGGDITMHLPLTEGRVLYVNIGLNIVDGKDNIYNVYGKGDDLKVTRIMFRVDNPGGKIIYGNNHFVAGDVTYGELLKSVRRVAHNYLPKQEAEVESKPSDASLSLSTPRGEEDADVARDEMVSDKKLAELDKEYGDDKVMGSHIKAEVKAREERAKERAGQHPSSVEFKDKQGNPINADGTLKLERLSDIDELTDADFSTPFRNVELPQLPSNVDAAIGANGKPVIIKKNIFEKNLRDHSDLTPTQSREILSSALYHPDLYGQNQKARRPYNWVVINTKDEQGHNRLVLLELNENKDNAEIVHWHYIDERGLGKIKRQAEREDGQLLILPSVTEEAGALSSPTSGLSSEGKVTSKTSDKQGKGKKKVKPEQQVGDLFAGLLDEAKDNGTEGNSVNHDENSEIHRTFAMVVKNDMLSSLDNGTKPYRGILDLRRRAKELGMDVDDDGRTDILLQELVEDGLVRAAREVVQRGGRDSKETYDLICKLYEMQPTIAARSSNRIKMQQYSTPLPMAWNAARFAMSGKESGMVLEPTAGNGMLVFAVPAGQVHANELDETRLANLREQGFAEVTQQDATEPFDGGRQYDVVIANPPFGKREAVEYDGKLIGGLDPQITLNALASMKDDGKAAIIIGGNMEYAKNGGLKGMKPFFTYLYDHYNVKGVVDMDGKLYAKQGTTYPTRMILIDGRRSDEERAQSAVYPPVQSKAVRKADSFEDLYNIVDEITNSNEKTNGTEILRSQQGQLLPDAGRGTGRGDGRPRSEQHTPNDGDGRRHGGHDVERAPHGGKDVLRGEHREDTGNGAPARGAGGDKRGASGRTGEPVVRGVDGVGVSGRGVGLTQTEKEKPKEHEKRTLTEEKLAYRPHNTAFSLESVAPAAMVEAMDRVLTEIEKKEGSIDEFVTRELGYDTIDDAHNALAAEQMDSVAMAIYQMKQGQAMIIGDQTGVGKGRQMAALIRWAVKRGEKPVFITQKADLFSDIYRDLVDVGSGDLVPFIFNSPTGENKGEMVDANGKVVHKGLSDAKMKKVLATGKLPDDCDYAVLTYSQVNTGDAISQEEAKAAAKKKGGRAKKSKSDGKATPKATFLRAIAKDNYLFLDESHTAAGTSNTGAYLQSILRGAKAATFASATFAKRPDTMPLYAIRTAMSQAKVEPDKMIGIIEKGGVTLQEIMSRELTNAGQMVRRERDMSDVRTDWKTIDDAETVKRARENYDRTITAFNAIVKFQEDYVKPLIDDLDEELAVYAESAGIKRGTDKLGVQNVPFASKTYNYTKQLMLALKVDAIVDEVEAEINAGRHPVIALESTMESSIKDYAAGEVIDEPTFSASLLRGLDSVMQYTVKDENGKESHAYYTPEQLGEAGEKAYYDLQKLIRESTSDIFISPLDAIIDRLHEKGYKVGELTGRNSYVERDGEGRVVVRRRTDKDKKRMQREFNNGELDVLILNKSASTGISLHASEKFSDQRQRTMIIAQPLSDINDYMQMIGRIDRTGQVHRGYYINLGLPVPAENRFLMMLSTKLKSLNANTTTSQDSESNEVDAPDLLNKYGSQVVVEYLRDNPDVYERMGSPLKKGGDNGKTPVKASELDEYKPQEDDARRITGSVALLSTKEQEDFYDDVVRRYNELMKYLNDTGNNDLKITVMPLRAKTIDKRVSSEGIDPNGSNPFARNSYVEKVEMDVLRKPMKADEVRKTIEQVNRGQTAEDHLRGIVATVKSEDEARMAAEDARYEKSLQKAGEDIAKQTEKINGQQKRTAEEKQGAIAAYTSETNERVEAKHGENMSRIKLNHQLLVSKLNMFEVGKSYLVPDNLETQVFNFAAPAIFCGYKAKDSKITASTTLAVFATLDGRRRVEVKLSQLEALNSIQKMTNDNWDAARSTTLDNWDSQIPTESRKEGYIMTGNILQAIADTQDEKGGYPGQLISYTDIDGNVHDGILMPDKWNSTMLKTSGAPIISRMQQIKEYKPIVSRDGKVEISGSEWARTYYLTVPKTKKDGAVYYENKTLLRAAGGIFYPYHGKLRADIAASDIEKVVKELSRLGVKVREEIPSEDDKTKFRLLDDDDPKAKELEALPESELVPVYRNVQAFEDDALGSPMAFTDAETGERRTLQGGKWNYSNPPEIHLTDERQRKLDELNKNGYIVVNGKKTTELQINDGLKFVKPKTKDAQLQYFLKKNPEDKGLWAAYDPYDHAIETPLNTQFGEAYKRPNLVVVRSLIPKSEIDEPFHADYALLPTGAHQWNNGRTLYLSRWSKIDKVLTREEEAKMIDEYWKKNPGKREALKTHRDYNRFVPQVRRELEKMGYRFELDGKELTPEESRALDEQNWESRDVIPGMEGQLPFISNEDIARINAKMAGKWVGEPKEAMENEMAERVNELAESLNTPVRIIRTDEEVAALPSARQRRMKGSFNPMTGEVTIVVPNNANMADVENTFIHEVVGHDGLRVLFPEEEKLNNALDELYRVSKDEIRNTIDRMAQKMYDAEVDRLREKKRREHEAKGEDTNASYYADMAEAHAEASKRKEQFKRDATEEYGADLAGRIGEKGFEKMSAEELTFWGKLKAMLQKALQKLLAGLKIPGKRKWSDKDWAFVLHEAYKRKKNGGNPTVFDAADTEVMRRKTGFGEIKFSDGKREQKPQLATTIADMKQRVTELFEKAKTGEFVGKPASIGRLSADGKAYLEKLSGLKFKDFVDFVLNPSDLNHIRSDHYGENEKDKGNNVPLTDEDIQNMVDVLNQPDGILYGVDKKDGRKLFFFLKDAGNGLYNLTEVCSTKKGNLTAKSFFKSKKKGISQRVMEIKDSLLPTSVTYSGEFLSSDAKIPTLFEINESSSKNVADEGIMFRDGDSVEYNKAMARDIYEQRVSRGLYQTQEALQDSMLGLKEAMDAILKAEGKGKTYYIEDVAGYENAYLGENRLSSVNQAECGEFARRLFKPMLEEVAKLAKSADARAELTDYMMAKHGLERNEVMARRAAEKDAAKEFYAELRKAERAAAKDPLDQDAADALDDVRQRQHDREEELYFENRGRDYAGLTALTGMDNVVDAEAEAQKMVTDYEKSHDTEDLWDKVNAVNAATLQKTYESGLISKGTYDDISGMYENYIPLRGFDEKTSSEAYAYLADKHSAFNSPIKTAKGRKSKADDPFANMEAMAESAIMQGNRNTLVKQKFLNFALNHPSDLVSVSDLWLWHNDAADEWQPINSGDLQGTERIETDDSAAEVERKMRDFEAAMEQAAKNDPGHFKKQKDDPTIPYRVVESRDLRQHQVLVKRGGRDIILTINGNPRAAQALNGQTNPDNDLSGAIGAILKGGEWLNRQLSAFYTTRNPDFVVSNFVRDMLYANTMVWVKESPNYAWRYNRNFARVNPAMMKLLFAKLRNGTLDMNDETEKMFHQFMMNGGETGYANIRDIDKRKNDIRRELKMYNGKLPLRKAWKMLGERLDEYNRAVENCARFAAFMTSRQMGRTIDKSIWDAKEISVNFNKKGSGAKFMGAEGQTKAGNAAAFTSGLGRSAYVFWNAAIQGTTNFGRQLGRNPKKAIAGVAVMFLLGALNAAIGGDDGDDGDGGKNDYFDLPEYTRRSNIVFRVPGMDKSWISLPLPTEYRGPYGMGELMVSAMRGKEHYTAGELASQMASQVSQLLPLDFMEGGGGWKPFVPSYIKPFAEVVKNESWTGMPIYKETPFNENDPEWTKAYKSANGYLVGASKKLNEWTGGDRYTKGWIDINPSKVEYLLNGLFGGMSRSIDELTKTGETILGEREYDPRSFMFLNRLVKRGDERTKYRAVNNEYFRIKEECEELRKRLNHYENDTEDGVFDYAEKIAWLNASPEYRILQTYEKYADDVDDINEELKEAEREGADEQEMKKLEEDLNQAKDVLVREVNAVRDGKR